MIIYDYILLYIIIYYYILLYIILFIFKGYAMEYVFER